MGERLGIVLYTVSFLAIAAFFAAVVLDTCHEDAACAKRGGVRVRGECLQRMP